jgi:hypothetical protein
MLHVIDGRCVFSTDNWLRRGPHLPMRGFEPARARSVTPFL